MTAAGDGEHDSQITGNLGIQRFTDFLGLKGFSVNFDMHALAVGYVNIDLRCGTI